MTYRVDWQPAAEAELTTVYLRALNHNAVTRASHALDVELGIDPLRFGRPRDSSVNRTAAVPPLGIDFEVIEDDKRVIVHAVFAV